MIWGWGAEKILGVTGETWEADDLGERLETWEADDLGDFRFGGDLEFWTILSKLQRMKNWEWKN